MTHFEHPGLAERPDTNPSGVSRIDRIAVSVANMEAAQTFYVEALGFRTVGLETRAGQAFAALTGVDDARASAVTMRLGDQTLELVQFTDPGRAYPEPRAANDPWFQHFAIAVSDMDRAFTGLVRLGAQPISDGGPQRLPPSTGDVVAYKFRDPDGHPLELSHAPKSHWAGASSATDRSTLGIDHSALAVADLEASIHFYTFGLGLHLGDPSLNQGPEQARLDGLDAPVVDIATLTTAQSGPHLELLSYRQPKSRAAPRTFSINDIAATRVVMHTQNLDRTVDRALAAGATRVSQTVVATLKGPSLLIRDPDGHLLELVEPNNRT